MGASNALQLELQERDSFKEIKEENANHINTVLYMRDIAPQKKRKNEHISEATKSKRNN